MLVPQLSRRSRVASLFLVSGLVATGCTFSDQLPLGAQVACRNSGDCPTGNICGASGHCVSETRPIRSVEVTPNLVREGQVVRLNFVAEVTLAGAPVVRATHRSSGETHPFVSVTEGFEWRVEPGFPQGVWDVRVDVRDTTGHTYLDLELGSFEVDLDAPRAMAERLQYVAPSTNLLVQAGFAGAVSAASQGTRVLVDFETSEPTAGPALQAMLADGGPSLEFDRAPESTPTRHRFSTTIRTPPDGNWRVVFTGADAVGNAAEQVLQPILVTDATPPAAPDVNREGEVVLRRELFGGPDAGGNPRQTVRFGSTTEVTALVALVNGALAAAKVTDPDGGRAALEFPPVTDDDTVLVRALDAAGNASPDVKVRDIEWVAWLGPGSSLTSPHQALPRIEQQPALRLDREISSAAPTGWPIEIAGGVSWHGPEAVTPLRAGSFGLDLEAGALRGVLPAGDGLIPDSIACSGVIWGTPAACVASNKSVQTDAGSGRVRFVIRDELRDEVLVTVSLNGVSGDTLAKVRVLSNGTLAADWFDAGASLPLIDELAYDYARDAIVLLGHRASDAGVLSPELWSSEGTWAQLDAGVMPPLRANAAFVSDPVRGGAWLAGGASFSTPIGARYSDLWRWDGQGWTQVLDGGADIGGSMGVHPPTGDVVFQSSASLLRFNGQRLTTIAMGQAAPFFTSWAALEGTGVVLGQAPYVTRAMSARAIQELNVTRVPEALVLATGPDASVVGLGATLLARFTLDAGWQTSPAPDSGVAHAVVATAVDEQGGLWAADELGVWGVDGAGWSLRADGADAGVLRGLSPSGLGVVRLTSTNARTSELARIDVTGAVTGLASLERFEPLALAADPLRHRMFVLGSPLIERTTGLQSEGLVLATVFDGGAVLERVSVASTTETPAPADQVSLVRIDDQQLLVASNKGMRWLALDKRAPPAIAVRVDTTSLHIPPGAAVRAIRYSASGGADGVEGGLPSSGLDSAQWLDGQWFPSLPTTGRHVAPTSTPAALEFLETRPIWLRRLLRPRQSLGWALSARRSAVIESSRLSVGWVSVEVSYRSPP